MGTGSEIALTTSLAPGNWHAAVLDLATGELKRVPAPPDLDFQYTGWTRDGRIIGYSASTRAALWEFSR